MNEGVRHPVVRRAAALFLLGWTLLLAVRVVVAVIRGNWVLALVGAALLAGSAGMTAWGWSMARR